MNELIANIMTDTPEAIAERETILRWLGGEVLPPHKWLHHHNLLVGFLWALTHPLKFYVEYSRFNTLCNAMDAIKRRDHLKQKEPK
jgi:hypothetical protein